MTTHSAKTTLKTLTAFAGLALCGLAFTGPVQSGSSAWHAVTPASLSGDYLAGRSASRARDNDRAAEFFARALKEDPANAVLIGRAFILNLSAGNIAKAEQFAGRIIGFNRKHRLSRLVMGLRDARAKSFEGARAHLKKAAFTPVGELTSGLLIAWTYAAENKLKTALDALKVLDRNSAFTAYKDFHAALIADYLNASAIAIKLYAKAYKNNANALRVVQAYGSFLVRYGKPEQARKIYTTFLERSRKNPLILAALANVDKGAQFPALIGTARDGMAEAMFSLASALSGSQSIDVSLIYTQLGLAMRSDFDVIRILQGEIYADTKRYAKSIEAYDKIPADSSLRASAEIQIAANLERLKRIDEAITRLKGLIERNPANTDALLTLANLYRANDKWKLGSAAYSKVLSRVKKVEKRHWPVFYYRGITYERSGQWDKAEKDFRRALELQPDQSSVLNYLGYSWIEKGLNRTEAMTMIRKAVSLKPNDGYIVDSLGWAHYQLGEYQKAVKNLERAVTLRPEDPVINDHLGDAYWRVGRKLEARFQWQHAKDAKPEPDVLKKIQSKLKNGLSDGPRTTPGNNEAPPKKS